MNGTGFKPRSTVALWVLLAVAGCSPPGKPNPEDRPVAPNEVTDFARLYAIHCAGCHGADGELGVAPPLNDPLFAAIVSEDQLREVIRAGRPGTPMPAFSEAHGGSLAEQQIDVLATGIKHHWKRDSTVPDEVPAYALRGTENTESSPEQRQRGAHVFERACAGCHGANGLGHERDGVMVGGINTPVFLGLISDQAIRRLIITGRPDLGMPDFRGASGRSDPFEPLTNAEIDDLMALISDWRRRTGSGIFFMSAGYVSKLRSR